MEKQGIRVDENGTPSPLLKKKNSSPTANMMPSIQVSPYTKNPLKVTKKNLRKWEKWKQEKNQLSLAM